MTILSILDKIASVPGRNDKLEILKTNKHNEDLKRFFYLALDPMVTFGIKKIPPYAPTGKNLQLSVAFGDLNKLITRELTGNMAIGFLSGVLAGLSKDDAEIIHRVIEKDPKCGLAEGSVNKIWPGLIFEFPVMKANPYDEKTIANIEFPAYSQTKLDGARCALVCRDGKVIALSSSGREIETHGQFDWCANIFDRHVVDGELLVVEHTGKFMERKKGNGIVNRAVKGTIPVEQAKQLHFVAFDLIDYDTWSGKKPAYMPYVNRFSLLSKLSASFRHNMSLVETLIVESEQEAIKHFKHLMVLGEEGTILKNTRALWEGKRSKDCVKFKGIISCDLRVIRAVEGEGKFAGKVGALLCESSDGLVNVSVGSGLTDSDRELPFDYWCDKIIEIAYNERIINKSEGSTWSLFLPRFIRVRLDKSIADTIDNIPLKLQ